MRAAEWIDRVKAVKGWESDYRVAKETGIRPNSVSTYRTKGSTMDDEAAFKVAAILGISPEIALADQARERAKSDQSKRAWSSILERLQGVAASIMLGAICVAGLGAGPDAQASGSYRTDSNSLLKGNQPLTACGPAVRF